MSEFHRRMLTITGATALAIGLVGCGAASAERLEGTPLVHRYEYDYTGKPVGGNYRVGTGINCLDGSAYDTDVYRGASASASVEGDETLAVSPTSSDGKTLRLVKQGNDQPLQPADETSRGILSAYGCNTQPYAR